MILKHIFLQLKYSIKVQKQVVTSCKNPKKAYYKYCFKKINVMNEMKQCTIPGMPPQKQIGIFTKGQKHLPMEHQYVTCTRHPEES